jgi:type III pantothenate kinase
MDMIAIDIGNSNVNLAVFVGEQMSPAVHIGLADQDKLADVLVRFRQACGEQPLGARTVPVVASSVNSVSLAVVEEAVAKGLDQNVLLIGREVPLGMKLAIENPETIGTDRLLAASAAYEVVQGAVVVADFGTATTIDCVNDQGIFLGGAILPGLRMAAQSLKEHTDALPLVEPVVPEHDFGVNTEMAIQNGIYYGAVGALRELVERYATALGKWPQVVLTGGYAELIAMKCDFADSLVPDLCLDGLYLAYKHFKASLEQEDQE